MSVACPFSSASSDHNRSWALSAAAQVFLRGCCIWRCVSASRVVQVIVHTSCKPHWWLIFWPNLCPLWVSKSCLFITQVKVIHSNSGYVFCFSKLNKGVSFCSLDTVLYNAWWTGLRGLNSESSRSKVTLVCWGINVKRVSFIIPGGAFGLPATIFANSIKIQPCVSLLSITLSFCLSPAGWASFFPLRNKWINSSDSHPPCGTISRVEKGETECRKTTSVYFECWSAWESWRCVCVYVCVQSLVTEHRPIWPS